MHVVSIEMIEFIFCLNLKKKKRPKFETSKLFHSFCLLQQLKLCFFFFVKFYRSLELHTHSLKNNKSETHKIELSTYAKLLKPLFKNAFKIKIVFSLE